MIPNDFPPSSSVYQQVQRWIAAGCFAALTHDLRKLLRMLSERAVQPSAAILDGRTLQSTPESGARAGYDGYKRKKGSKVHNHRLQVGFHRPMKISLLLAVCAAVLLSTPVIAEEGDPLRGKIKELEERARTAKEQGWADESKELMQQARRLHAEMIEHGGGDKLEMTKRKIEEFHRAGKHEEAAQLERRLHGAKQHPGDRELQEGGSDAERRQHALEAIKHLHAAGFHEPAERIEQMLREHEKGAGTDNREKGERRGPEGVNPREGQEQMQRAMREVQEQIQRAMRETQEQTQRALRDTHEQMAKMARTIEELRAQVARQRGDGGPEKR